MTAASELKSAAVVQIETRKRKTQSHTEDQKATRNTVSAINSAAKQAAKQEAPKQEAPKHAVAETESTEVQIEAVRGSTTATVTESVTRATSLVVLATAKNATSGSTAARHTGAASLRATRLPVSVFSKNSPVFLTIQQNPVRLRQIDAGVVFARGSRG